MSENVLITKQKLDGILDNAKDILIDSLVGMCQGGDEVFPEACATAEYCIAEEADGTIMIPTIYRMGRKKVFVKLTAELDII